VRLTCRLARDVTDGDGVAIGVQRAGAALDTSRPGLVTAAYVAVAVAVRCWAE